MTSPPLTSTLGRLKAELRVRAETYHLRGLNGVRSHLKLALVERDHAAPVMAETLELSIPTPAGGLPARLYRPHAAADNGPALLFFHGGGFVLCDLETHDALCRRLAAAAGMCVVSAHYRLAPESPFPGQVEDAEAAARWLGLQASSLAIDPARIAYGGDSAGAYLAVAVAAKLNGEQPGFCAGQVLIYPLLQLDDEAWASSVLADTRAVGRLAVRYIRAQLGDGALTAPTLLAADHRTPPTLIATGGLLDPCRRHALDYHELLQAAGARVVLKEYPALTHGLANLTHVAPGASSAVHDIGVRMADLMRLQPEGAR